MRLSLALLVLLSPGPALAEQDCAAAEQHFAAVMTEGKDDLFRADVAASVADPATRWIFAATALLGAALPLENGQATPEQAALLLAADPLLDCWRPDPATATAEQIAQAEGIDRLLPDDRRARLVELAGGQP